MPHGSKYGSGITIVQDRQHRPSSTYSGGSSTTRSSGSSSSYYTPTMDSSSSSRSSSSSKKVDRTGTYRTPGSDGYLTTVKINKKGKKDVVIVQHNCGDADPYAPRASGHSPSDRRR